MSLGMLNLFSVTFFPCSVRSYSSVYPFSLHLPSPRANVSVMKSFFPSLCVRGIFCLTLIGLPTCGYRVVDRERGFVGGYRLVSVPVFKNRTEEPRLELIFSNALREEFHRAPSIRVGDASVAPVTVLGIVDRVRYAREATVRGAGDDTQGEIPALPENARLTTRYRIYITVNLTVVRNADGKTLWSGKFRNERGYLAPQIGTESINSANALYNQSARLQNAKLIAREMMAEAYNRMTENF